jgi:RNase P subunit RPR2
MLYAKNDWLNEIEVRIVKVERAAYAINKFLKSKFFSMKTKTKLYTTIRSTLTYGCEAWTTTSTNEKRLRTFENRIWRTICGPTCDSTNAIRRRKYNKKL